MATVPKRAAQPQKYFTYNPKDSRSHLKIKAGQHAAFAKDLGWYAAPGATKKPQITVDVKRSGTPQNYGTTIESPAQIEARVTRMAQSAYDRQQSDLDAEVARMRKEAEGRRLGMIAAYQAAGKQNAEMAGQVQNGWNTAADTLQGIAGSTTGGIGDALRADVAAQEQALSRVGAGGTGFDATSQQAVEQFRGGALPAESFARYGGIANEYLQRMPDNLKREGLAGAYSAEGQDLAKIMQDRLTQVRTLGENRVKYETDLRDQLLGARKEQINAVNDAAKIIADVATAKAKLKSQYQIALLRATTQKEIQAAKDIYAAENHALDVQESNALTAQRNASAGLSNAKAGVVAANPTGAKPPSATAVSNNIVRANKAGTQALDAILQNIWANAPGQPFVKGDETTKKYADAVAWQKRQRTRSFKTAYTKVVKAISPHLKAVNYTPLQVQKLAWEIVAAKVTPPTGLKPPGWKATTTAAVPGGVFATPSWMQ